MKYFVLSRRVMRNAYHMKRKQKQSNDNESNRNLRVRRKCRYVEDEAEADEDSESPSSSEGSENNLEQQFINDDSSEEDIDFNHNAVDNELDNNDDCDPHSREDRHAESSSNNGLSELHVPVPETFLQSPKKKVPVSVFLFFLISLSHIPL